MFAKGARLTAQRADFELLETMWEPETGIFLWDRHLERLAGSAEYFGMALDLGNIEHEVAAAVALLPGQPHRLRLLVDQEAWPASKSSRCRTRLNNSRCGWAWRLNRSIDGISFSITRRRGARRTKPLVAPGPMRRCATVERAREITETAWPMSPCD